MAEERALTAEAVLSGLRDIRLPQTGPVDRIADHMATAGLAVLTVSVIAWLLPLVTQRRQTGQPGSLTERIAEAGRLPEETRRIVLFRLLREHAPRSALLNRDIYRPGGLPTIVEMEAELSRDV